MYNNDNQYQIDKSTLPTVRFDPSDSSYFTSNKILRMAKYLTMQKVRKTVQRFFPTGFNFARSDPSDPTKLFTVGQLFPDSNSYILSLPRKKNILLALLVEISLKTQI